MQLLPGAAPYRSEGDPPGILALHGCAGSPACTTPWARCVADAGHSVAASLLPGPVTRRRDHTAPTWGHEADRGLDWLTRRSDTVVVMGVSSGATIGLCLAEARAGVVAGLAAVNTVVQSAHRARRRTVAA